MYTALGGISAVVGEGTTITQREILRKAVSATKAGAKGVGRPGAATAGLGLITLGVQYYNSDQNPSDIARLGGSLLIASTVFISYVGPEISFGLGMADSVGLLKAFLNHLTTQ